MWCSDGHFHMGPKFLCLSVLEPSQTGWCGGFLHSERCYFWLLWTPSSFRVTSSWSPSSYKSEGPEGQQEATGCNLYLQIIATSLPQKSILLQSWACGKGQLRSGRKRGRTGDQDGEALMNKGSMHVRAQVPQKRQKWDLSECCPLRARVWVGMAIEAGASAWRPPWGQHPRSLGPLCALHR